MTGHCATGIRLLLAALMLVPVAAWAQQVQLKALFGSRAMLEVDGRQHILSAGQSTPGGVRLLALEDGAVRIAIDGREQRLTMAAPIASAYQQAARAEVRLGADTRGHYFTHALVNGRRVQVLVDTGATSLAFNYPTAQRLGLDLKRAQEIRVSTASGIARAYRVTLPSVTVGGIVVYNVDATVHADDFPEVALLGNSFLARVDLEQQGRMLVLRARN